MSDDPRLGVFLNQFFQDQADGMTVRSLHKRLDEHIKEDRETTSALRDDIQSLRESRAYDQGQKSGGEFGGPERTGRFNIGPVATPPPFPAPLQPIQPLVEVHVDGNGRRRKTSIPPAVSKLLHSRIVQLVLAALVSALLGWASRHVGLGAPAGPPPVLVPVPAPTPAK